jgi:hypothetical protein
MRRWATSFRCGRRGRRRGSRRPAFRRSGRRCRWCRRLQRRWSCRGGALSITGAQGGTSLVAIGSKRIEEASLRHVFIVRAGRARLSPALVVGDADAVFDHHGRRRGHHRRLVWRLDGGARFWFLEKHVQKGVAHLRLLGGRCRRRGRWSRRVPAKHLSEPGALRAFALRRASGPLQQLGRDLRNQRRFVLIVFVVRLEGRPWLVFTRRRGRRRGGGSLRAIERRLLRRRGGRELVGRFAACTFRLGIGARAVGNLPGVERFIPLLFVSRSGKGGLPIVVGHVTPMPSLPRSSR